ncbi:hypothetical protein Lal_00033589 [Lupinus albus]|nr:hypothetical protein Lal_00033589 [Lupinus albus]
MGELVLDGGETHVGTCVEVEEESYEGTCDVVVEESFGAIVYCPFRFYPLISLGLHISIIFEKRPRSHFLVLYLIVLLFSSGTTSITCVAVLGDTDVGTCVEVEEESYEGTCDVVVEESDEGTYVLLVGENGACGEDDGGACVV